MGDTLRVDTTPHTKHSHFSGHSQTSITATKKDNHKLQVSHKPLVKACLDRNPVDVVNLLNRETAVQNFIGPSLW
jgi:hypothetical protein